MVTFNINLFSIKKSFWFPRLSSVTMATSLSEVLEIFRSYCSICFLITKFQKFSKVNSELIFEESTAKYSQIPNFSEISQGVWELRASEI